MTHEIGHILGLPGGQPGGLPGSGAAAATPGEGLAPQVHDVQGQEQEGDPEADPEAGADEQHADQLDDVEQQ
ncbi:hypothetical protein GUI43_06571 [Micromonospora noduli]|nr:hypothetical protein GUI43_06571 [Micromonospora noduli]